MKLLLSRYLSLCQRQRFPLKIKCYSNTSSFCFTTKFHDISNLTFARFFQTSTSLKVIYSDTSARGLTEDIRIPVPWGHVAGKVCGDFNAPPVLCLHGWLDNCNSFDKLIPLLPKDKFFVFIDLPGHGKSSGLPTGSFYAFFHYASLVERLRRHFSWQHFSFLCHSLGGNIGGVYSGTFPERVDKLIMIDVWGIHVLRPGTEVESLRLAVESYAKYETLINRTPPSYSYEEAKKKLLKANESLSSQSADILLERGAERQPDGTYRFTRDIRHTYRHPTGIHLNSALYFLSNIHAEAFHIIANDGMMMKFIQNNKEYEKIIKKFLNEGFRKCEYYQRVDVDGKHHVHLCNPENIIDHVTEMLNRPIRAGLLKSN